MVKNMSKEEERERERQSYAKTGRQIDMQSFEHIKALTLNRSNINNFTRAIGNHALLGNVLGEQKISPDIQIHDLYTIKIK